MTDRRQKLAEAEANANADLLAIMQRIAGTGPLDVMNVRMIIEPQAAAAAAATATDAELAHILRAHEAASAAGEPGLFEALDGDFHRAIFLSTRNEFLTSLQDMLGVVRSRSAWIEIKRQTFSEERRLIYCHEHGLILEALLARDSDAAAQAMRSHLATVNRILFGGVGLL